MKIHLWAPRFAEGGGIQAFSAEMARALQDHDVRLIAQRQSTFEQRVFYPAGENFPLLPFRFALLLIWKAICDRPNLIISTHLNFGPIAFFLKRLLGIPYVLVGHGIDIDSKLSQSRKRGIENADLILGVSQHSVDRFEALKDIRPRRVSILPNTVDEERFAMGAKYSQILLHHRIAKTAKVILTVCRLSASEGYKGYDQIIRGLPAVIESIPAVHFLIVGKGDDCIRIEELVDELKLREHVTLAGFIPDDKLADYYRTADVFAMPSYGEGFGIVFLEAMACGIPVLAGNQDGSVDALANGELGCLVDPLSVDEVAAGLISLFKKEGPEWWFQPDQLRSRMLRRFGRHVFRKKLLEIVDEVIRTKGDKQKTSGPLLKSGDV